MSSTARHVACCACRDRKIRCNGAQPRCLRCVKHEAECVYAPPRSQELNQEEVSRMLTTLNRRLGIIFDRLTPNVATDADGTLQKMLRPSLQCRIHFHC